MLDRLDTIVLTGNPLKDRYLRQKLIRSNSSLQCINGKDISEVERVFTERMGKLKKVVKKTVVEEPIQGTKPIPHLPPYATQYRDLILQQIQEHSSN